MTHGYRRLSRGSFAGQIMSSILSGCLEPALQHPVLPYALQEQSDLVLVP